MQGEAGDPRDPRDPSYHPEMGASEHAHQITQEHRNMEILVKPPQWG